MLNFENKLLSPNVVSYLKKYSFRIEELNQNNNYECIVVIPVLNEYENLPSLLESLLKQNKYYLKKTLFIFVVNNSETASKEVVDDNHKSIQFLRSESNNTVLNISVIDSSSHGNELPEKTAGVGLARKIGMDTALCYFDYSSKNKNFLVCLDGDCTVSENYLEELFENINTKKLKAGYVKYYHTLSNDEEINKAIIIYEIFLRYYVLGLKFADSPYAFHTIGSTMFCDIESYIKIEGMNKRKAAEDFYFMEKLSKITKIEEINSAYVYPSSRPSWRVPFGTGQRVNRFLSKSQNEYLLYSPKSFKVLKDWLMIFNNEENKSSSFYLDEAKKISTHLFDFLELNKFESAWNKISENASKPEQIKNQKKLWFDGFRTLKLIHYLRDNQFGLINIFDAVDEMIEMINPDFKIKRSKEIPAIEIQLEYLNLLRKLA